MKLVIEPPTLEEIRTARSRIASAIARTPLVRLNVGEAPSPIYLKLENLQPIGSFKLRGATNAMRLLPRDRLAQGVYTASAGNMAQGVAWSAREMGVPCSVIMPDRAPQTKLAAIERLGAAIVKVPFDRWWQVIVDHEFPGMKGCFIHPVASSAVIAGNGTIGLEILEELPDVEAILAPFGGGGLTSGIAAAVKALKPDTRVFACEVETAAPLAASLAAGAPRWIDVIPSFVDGIGGRGILEPMWPMVRRLVDGSLTVGVREVADAIRLLVERNQVVAEGAGATPVAAALAGKAPPGKVVCVVSGGNIDPHKLARILEGEIPPAG